MKRLGLILLLQLTFSLAIVAQTQHKVKKGETMESIAKEYGIGVAQLMRANPGLKNVRKGQVIDIPATKNLKTRAQTGKEKETHTTQSKSSEKAKTDKKLLASNTKKKPLTKEELRAKEREKAERKERRKEKWQKVKDFMSPLTSAVGAALLDVANEQIVVGVTNFTNKLTGKNDDGYEIYRSGGKSGYDKVYGSSSSSMRKAPGENFTGTPLNPTSGTLNIDRQLERLAAYDAELDRMATWCNERAEEVRGTGRPMVSSNNGGGSRRAQNRAQNRPAGAVTAGQKVGSNAYRHIGNLSADGQIAFGQIQNMASYGKREALTYIRSCKATAAKDANWLRSLKSQGYTTVTAEEYHNKQVQSINSYHNKEMKREDAKRQQIYKRRYDQSKKARDEVMRNPEKYSNPQKLIDKYNKEMEDILEKME